MIVCILFSCRYVELYIGLTVGLLAGLLQYALLVLLDDDRLEASIVDQRTTTGWISVLEIKID